MVRWGGVCEEKFEKLIKIPLRRIIFVEIRMAYERPQGSIFFPPRRECRPVICIYPPPNITSSFPVGGHWLDKNNKAHKFNGFEIKINKAKYKIGLGADSFRIMNLIQEKIDKGVKYEYYKNRMLEMKNFKGRLYIYKIAKENKYDFQFYISSFKCD